MNSIFNKIKIDNKIYIPVVICTKERVEQTADYLKSIGLKNLVYIPINNLDGAICYESK